MSRTTVNVAGTIRASVGHQAGFVEGHVNPVETALSVRADREEQFGIVFDAYVRSNIGSHSITCWWRTSSMPLV